MFTYPQFSSHYKLLKAAKLNRLWQCAVPSTPGFYNDDALALKSISHLAGSNLVVELPAVS